MTRKRSITAAISIAAAVAITMAGCVGGSSSGGRQTLQLWFWGAPPQQQETMQKVLVDGFNASQSRYTVQDKLADMTAYAKKYGWEDRILTPMYQSGTVDGKLYSLPNSIEDIGVFYNTRVLEKLGVAVPQTYSEFITVMDKAAAAGLYPSV